MDSDGFLQITAHGAVLAVVFVLSVGVASSWWRVGTACAAEARRKPADRVYTVVVEVLRDAAFATCALISAAAFAVVV